MLSIKFFGFVMMITIKKAKPSFVSVNKDVKMKPKGKEGIQMGTVFDVAKYFLSQERPDERWAITHLKLQKLVYYAQGWSWALRGKPLFHNTLESWAHGPVSPELYRKYRVFGFSTIPQCDAPSIVLNEDDCRLLAAVWNKYGFKDARALEFMTHEETPWRNAWNNTSGHGRGKKIITDDSIRKYFCSLISG